jgi:uncharacterized protein
MTSSPFQRFIDLINFDKSLISLEQSIDDLHGKMKAIHDSITVLEKSLIESKNSYTTARKNVDEQELHMKELNEAESVCKKKLDAVTNQKEYKALSTELEAIQAKQQDQEVTLLTAWNAVEQAEKIYMQKEQEIQEEKATLKSQHDQLLQQIEDLEKKLDTQQHEREKKIALVHPEWLEKYAAMRSRVANPVVPMLNGMCSGCFLSLPPQIMADLRHKKMLQCNQCYRFLYIPETQEMESEGKTE